MALTKISSNMLTSTATVLNGAGVPDVGLGSDGDFYIDTAANTIYGPKTGVWGAATNVVGPEGPSGAPPTSVTNALANFTDAVGTISNSKLLLLENAAAVQTTDATVTPLQTIPIPTNSTTIIEFRVVARRTGGAAGASGDGLTYSAAVKAKNIAGVVTMGTVQQGFSDKEQALWAVSTSVSTTNVIISGAGAVNNNIDWHCSTLVRSVT